jgi:hypothetical protein
MAGLLALLVGLRAEEWSAIASWATVGVAVAAAIVALRQFREARRLRLEQAQPYVVVYLEEAGVRQSIDLVIKNLGATAATGIEVRLHPPPERAIDTGETTWSPLLPETLPVLVPNQEWRTVFDTTSARGRAGNLPRRYKASVSFKDARGKENFAFEYVLDWNLILERASVVEYGLHDLAKAARDVRQEIQGWKEGGGRRGLRVYLREAHAGRRSVLQRLAARMIRGARSAIGVSAVGDVWWGEEWRRRRKREQRVASHRVGRLLQRLFR